MRLSLARAFVLLAIAGLPPPALADDLPAPPPVTAPAKVCFYRGPTFTDARFCAVPGDHADTMPSGFGGAVESILVSGNASVKVCTGYALHGDCATLAVSAPRLPYAVRDVIVSYAVSPRTPPG